MGVLANPLLRQFREWAWKFLRHHRPAMVGVILVAAVLLTALFGPLLCSYGPNEVHERFAVASLTRMLGTYDEDTPAIAILVQEIYAQLTTPNIHWLGTDSQGYDVLTRMVYGSRTTLIIALVSMSLSLILGTAVGAVAGFVGGKTDLVLMRCVDFAMSFPGFLLAMVTVAVLGFDLRNVIVAVGLVGAPMFARQVRAEVIRVRTLEFVTAARAMGIPPARALLLHVLPNSLAPIVVLGTLGMGSAILDVAGLNFLGLGGDPFETPEWGLILAQGWDKRPDANLQIALAGLAIFVTVLGFNLLGDGLKDELDPRTRRR